MRKFFISAIIISIGLGSFTSCNHDLNSVDKRKKKLEKKKRKNPDDCPKLDC